MRIVIRATSALALAAAAAATLAGCSGSTASLFTDSHLGQTYEVFRDVTPSAASINADAGREFYAVQYGSDQDPANKATLIDVFLDPTYRAAIEKGFQAEGFTRTGADTWHGTAGHEFDTVAQGTSWDITFTTLAKGSTLQPRYSSRPLTLPADGFQVKVVETEPKPTKPPSN